MQTTAHRKYNVSIIAHKNAPQIADNTPMNFDCLVSEPSIWIDAGTTTAKGLSFVDKSGGQLNSSLFRNQAFFHVENDQSEEKAIESLVYTTLFEHYSFEKSDVKVIVTKY